MADYSSRGVYIGKLECDFANEDVVLQGLALGAEIIHFTATVHMIQL